MTENRKDNVPEPNPDMSDRGRPLIPKSAVLNLGARLLGYMAEREGPRPMCGRELSEALREWAEE